MVENYILYIVIFLSFMAIGVSISTVVYSRQLRKEHQRTLRLIDEFNEINLPETFKKLNENNKSKR